MILTFDVGNTETTVGLFNGDDLFSHWRLTTGVPRTHDEFGMLLHTLLETSGIKATEVSGSAICSVVPPVTSKLARACEDCFGSPSVMIDARAKLPVTLLVDEPLSVGADRVANTLAATTIWHRDAIVVDLGTATTYDCITADGAFIGGIIQPGVRSSAETLFSKTSQLAATELFAPVKVIGTRTDECIRSGVIFGAADAIDGLVGRIKREWGKKDVLVIGTGGLAETLRPLVNSFDEVDPFLTLKGVRIGYEILKK